MPITEALKKLIKTITGKNAVGETIEELVQNLNDNYPEGGSGGGGGGSDNDFVINATFDEYFRLSNFTHDGESVDKDDVTAAFNDGKQVYIAASGTGLAEGTHAHLSMTQNVTGTLMFSGTGVVGENGVPKWKIFSAMLTSFSDGVTLQIGDTLPNATNDDIGKIPMVNNNRSYYLVSPSALDYIVTFTTGKDGDGNPTASTTTPISDIIAAKNAGKTVKGVANIGLYQQEFPLVAWGDGGMGNGMVAFGTVLPNASEQKPNSFALEGDVYIQDGVAHDIWKLFIG